jgi:hypothetical protein
LYLTGPETGLLGQLRGFRVKTSMRLLLTALLISGITWATAGTPAPPTTSPAASLALLDH